MADDDQDKPQPNLEPPKLFGRKSRSEKVRPAPEPEPTPEAELASQPEPEPEEPHGDELELPPAAASAPEPVSEDDDPPAGDPTIVQPVSDPTWMFEPPETDPEPRPAVAREPDPTPIEPEPVTAVLPAEAGTPLFADEVEDAPARTKVRRPRVPRPAGEQRPPKPPKPPKPPRTPRARRLPLSGATAVSGPALPTVAGWIAAAATGLVIGLLLVGLTAGSLQACEAVRGTSTCGGSGALILIVIMALLVTLGGLMLRAFHVPDPVSTSFLAVGMVAVIALLFLLEVLENWWVILVIPPISVAMYLLAYWVTTTFVEPAKDSVDA